MGKYHYVSLCNCYEAEMSEATKNAITSTSLYYSGPSISCLPGIRQVYKKRQEKFLGIKYESEYLAYDPMRIICEDRQFTDGSTCLLDVISGKAYHVYNYNNNKPTSTPVFSPVSEINPNEVAAFLKRLTAQEIQRYVEAAEELDRCVRIGYNNYVRRVKRVNREIDEAEAYIKQFRKNHGK
jgi:hypothetical protein